MSQSCLWVTPLGRSLDTLLRHMPLGPAWQAFRTSGKRAYRMMSAFAGVYEEAWAALCNLVVELNPSTTEALLPEWEAALGLPDQCLPSAQTLDQRRAQLLFRLTKRRWTTAQDWKDLAALFGLRIIVTPGWYVGNGNDVFTKALLHFEGVDGATLFTDSNAGGSAHVWTAHGNAQIDTTAASRLGSGSGLFDGVGDYISTPAHADFALGSDDFTIDFEFKCNAPGGTTRNLAGQCDSSGTPTTISFNIRRRPTNTLRATVNVGSTAYNVDGALSFTDTINPGWHHGAFVRTGNTLRLLIDGVQDGADVIISGSVNTSANALAIGRNGEVAGSEWTGWVDEFRLSRVARWTTTTFTPPQLEYGLYPRGGRFRTYIDLVGVEGGAGYPYGSPSAGPGYPLPYGANNALFDAFVCLIDRIRPANTVVIFNANPLRFFCYLGTYEGSYAETYCGDLLLDNLEAGA